MLQSFENNLFSKDDKNEKLTINEKTGHLTICSYDPVHKNICEQRCTATQLCKDCQTSNEHVPTTCKHSSWCGKKCTEITYHLSCDKYLCQDHWKGYVDYMNKDAISNTYDVHLSICANICRIEKRKKCSFWNEIPGYKINQYNCQEILGLPGDEKYDHFSWERMIQAEQKSIKNLLFQERAQLIEKLASPKRKTEDTEEPASKRQLRTCRVCRKKEVIANQLQCIKCDTPMSESDE